MSQGAKQELDEEFVPVKRSELQRILELLDKLAALIEGPEEALLLEACA